MAISAGRYRQLYGKRGYRPQSVINRAAGEIRLKQGRAEGAGVPFNLFPQIADRLPAALAAIVVETTENVARKAKEKTPVGEVTKPNHRPGTLKESQRIIYYRSRQTGEVVTGRIDYMAVDPDGGKHFYGFYVEFGSRGHPGRPFLIPALISERQEFNRRCRDLEKLLT